MAMPRKIPMDFGVVFPYGVYAVGEVQPVRDYDRSTQDKIVQATDQDTGLPLWSVDIIDADPDAKKSNRSISVKVLARVQPVLPELMPGTPFRQVEFDKLQATPYVEQSGDFSRLAWSYRASDVRAPRNGAAKPAEQKPDQKAGV